jgi:putative ABC transport system substrate-binding protein
MAARVATLLLLVVAAFAAEAQPAPKAHRVGFVGSGEPGPGIDAFRHSMRDLGYVEGRNLVLEVRFPGSQPERIPQLVDEVLRLNVELLVVGSTPAALAAKRATTRTPIVFASLFDPVGSGVVSNLAQPGANITGVAIGVGGSGMAGKWIELLKEALPDVSRVAVLSNSRNPASAASLREVDAAARALSVKLDVFDAGNAARLDAALEAIGARGAQALVVTNDPFFTAQRGRLVEFAAQSRLPAVYFFRSFAEAGGLMAYGADQREVYRRAAHYADKILKGAKPAALPIEQPTRLELVINLKAARALGLKIPQSLLVRADEVIQ